MEEVFSILRNKSESVEYKNRKQEWSKLQECGQNK